MWSLTITAHRLKMNIYDQEHAQQKCIQESFKAIELSERHKGVIR